MTFPRTLRPAGAAIPKASSEERLKGNLDIADFELSEEEMGRVFELAR